MHAVAHVVVVVFLALLVIDSPSLGAPPEGRRRVALRRSAPAPYGARLGPERRLGGPSPAGTITLAAPDGHEDQWFGYAVALEDDRLAVGAPRDDERGESAGAVYVFRQAAGRWVLEAKLTAGEARPFAMFGRAVVMAGPWLAVGAPGFSWPRPPLPQVGAVELYRAGPGGWRHAARLLNPDLDPAAGRGAAWGFGEELAMRVGADGTALLVVGAPEAPLEDRMRAGAVYVFRFDGESWVFTSRLAPSGLAAHARLGRSISTWPGFIAAGAPSDPDFSQQPGAAWIFRAAADDDWLVETVLQGAAPWGADGFGLAVGGYCDRLVVGAPLLDGGAAHVHRRGAGGWAHEESLVAARPHRFAHFGEPLAIAPGERGPIVAIAARGVDSVEFFSPRATGWSSLDVIGGAGAPTAGGFGTAVDIDPPRAAIGAPFDSPLGAARGGAVLIVDSAGVW